MFSIINRSSKLVLVATLACALAACVFGPRKTDAERQVDRETADRVQAALSADRILYSRHITVNADGGVVSLGGYVWSQPDLEEAQRIAEGVQGVKKVVNEMELERGGIDNSPVSR